MQSYKNLEAWKKSMQLVKEIYVLAKKFPKEELYGLTAQIKGAAVSVPSNIAEGIGRNHKKETIQFLHISRGSLYELDTQLCISLDVGFIRLENYQYFFPLIEECQKILNGLITYYEKSNLK